MQPLINLRCLRFSDDEESQDEPLTPYEEKVREEVDKAMLEAEERSEILKQEDFTVFEELFSHDAGSAEQMILNRCLYETVSLLLD